MGGLCQRSSSIARTNPLSLTIRAIEEEDCSSLLEFWSLQRTAWRGSLIRHQSIPISQSCARNIASDRGDIDIVTVETHTFLADLIETLELVAAERTCDAVACELDWWTLVGRLAALAGRWACRPLKFALVTVFAAYVAGWVERYVLPILRFFLEIPW